VQYALLREVLAAARLGGTREDVVAPDSQGILAPRRWAAHSCVPAFLEAAIAEVVPTSGRLPVDCAALARAAGVVLPPDTSNPWGLPTSDDPSRLGVTPADAKTRFPAVCDLICGDPAVEVELDIVPLNTIAFELYEDEIVEQQARGGVVGLSVDYVELHGPGDGREAVSARHVVRLTPTRRDIPAAPTVASAEFGFDYRGAINVFDDSGETRPDLTILPWRRLIAASRAGDGALWVVTRRR
jgi:hypothetical protein